MISARLLVYLLTCIVRTASKDWWESASFYQIYPRSFKDSNGDGVGDLNGIREKLPYLKEIGITAFWISPIFASPMADFGYDISNFYAIQPEYGTMNDFDRMVAAAKQLNIKVILDFVPNHSSDEHDWFRKSVRRDPQFENFYIWDEGRFNEANASAPLPPNNWLSVFRGSGWTWNVERGQFYYHAFLDKQPDLNYRNPDVVAEMKRVLRFWLAKGVDGFRIDAVPNLFEKEKDHNGVYFDEPRSNETEDSEDYKYLSHIYTQDQPETLDMVYQWRSVIDEFQRENDGDSKVLLAETGSPIDIVMQYYGNQQRHGAHMPFNFQLLLNLNNQSSAADYERLINLWMSNMPEGRAANWVMGNHDQKRIASRHGIQRVDAINMILASLPGASITYNGDEIGMTDVWISWEDTVDPGACNTNPQDYEAASRDPARTPLQWDDTTSAGFSTNPKTWLPVALDYETNNVKNQQVSQNSHLKVFKELRTLKTSEVWTNGALKTYTLNDNNVLVIIRELLGIDIFVTLVNFGGNQEQVDLSMVARLRDNLVFLAVDTKGLRRRGALISKRAVQLVPYEAVILKNESFKMEASILFIFFAFFFTLYSE